MHARLAPIPDSFKCASAFNAFCEPLSVPDSFKML